jgi:hypothetical protein
MRRTAARPVLAGGGRRNGETSRARTARFGIVDSPYLIAVETDQSTDEGEDNIAAFGKHVLVFLQVT